jgi:hypothetical protein
VNFRRAKKRDQFPNAQGIGLPPTSGGVLELARRNQHSFVVLACCGWPLDMEKFSLKTISPAHAAHVLRCERANPAGLHTPTSRAAAGLHARHQRRQGDHGATRRAVWIHGAGASGGRRLAFDGLGVVETLADQGSRLRGIQTGRLAWLRIAKKTKATGSPSFSKRKNDDLTKNTLRGGLAFGRWRWCKPGGRI